MAKRRTKDKARHAAQSSVQRDSLLQCRRDKIASETPEDREKRLESMRQRVASETPEERETRLQKMSLSQQQRIASDCIPLLNQ